MSKAFFDVVRSGFGRLSKNQVEGLNALLAATEGLPLRHRAYILATAWHETGPASSPWHMTPRREVWRGTRAQLRYEGNVKGLGNTVRGDGKRYMGRGYVQITGRRNYALASELTGVDLLLKPDRAMDAHIAAKIIVDGMTKGWFTGLKMADFRTFLDMRRVVNGTDKAATIADYAEIFQRALFAEQQASLGSFQARPLALMGEDKQAAILAGSVLAVPVLIIAAVGFGLWWIFS